MKHMGSTHHSGLYVSHLSLQLFVLLATASFSLSVLTPPRILYGGWKPILPGNPFHFGAPERHRYIEQPSHYHSYHHDAPQHEEHYNEELFTPVSDPVEEHEVVQHQEYRLSPHNQSPRTPKKDIFSYYPPQSSYDRPPHIGNVEHKPVYAEFARKPMDMYDNPQLNGYKLHSLHKSPLGEFNLGHLNSESPHHDEQTFLKITPLSHTDSSLKNVDDGMSSISYLPNGGNKAPYQFLHDSAEGALLQTHKQRLFPPIPKQPLKSGNHAPSVQLIEQDHIGLLNHQGHLPKSLPILKNTDHIPFQILHESQLQIENGQAVPIKYQQINLDKSVLGNQGLKNLRITPSNALLQDIKLAQELLSVTPVHHNKNKNYLLEHNLRKNKGNSDYLTDYQILKGNNNKQIYHLNSYPHHSLRNKFPHKSNIYPKVNHQYKPLSEGAATEYLLSQHGINKNIAAQIQKFLSPKVNYNYPIKSLHSLQNHRLLRNPNIISLKEAQENNYRPLKESLMPNILNQYFHKSARVEGHYKNPSIVTTVQGTPAIVEREVAIVQVPVDQQKYLQNLQVHPDHEEVFYQTGSAPESSVVPHFQPSSGNFNYNMASRKVGSANDSNPSGQSVVGHSKDISNSNNDGFMFVGSDKKDSDLSSPDLKRQNLPQTVSHQQGQNVIFPTSQPIPKEEVFHAYYAPSDHKPPSGYVKMSVKEFDDAFKNAEIRYVDDETKIFSEEKEKKTSQ